MTVAKIYRGGVRDCEPVSLSVLSGALICARAHVPLCKLPMPPCSHQAFPCALNYDLLRTTSVVPQPVPLILAVKLAYHCRGKRLGARHSRGGGRSVHSGVAGLASRTGPEQRS